MKRNFLANLFIGIIFSWLIFSPGFVDAACGYDHYGECVGGCNCPAGQTGCFCNDTGGSCTADTSGCSSDGPTNTPVPRATEAPTLTPRPTQAACDASHPIACDDGIHCCKSGYYCCQGGCGGGTNCCCHVGDITPTGGGGGGSKTCNQLCVNNNSCVSGLTCFDTGLLKRCRNPDCTSEINCACPPTPTPTITLTPIPPTPTATPADTPTPTPTTPAGCPVLTASCGSFNPATGYTPITWDWSPVSDSGLQVREGDSWSGDWLFNNWVIPPPKTLTDILAGTTVGARVTYDFVSFCPIIYTTCPTPTVTPTRTPMPTRTPTPSPIPGPWIKLRSTSFYSTGNLVNNIPQAPVAYDADDDANPYFIIQGSSGGLAAAALINLTTVNPDAKANASDWLANGYTLLFNMTPSSFKNYVTASQKPRKNFRGQCQQANKGLQSRST